MAWPSARKETNGAKASLSVICTVRGSTAMRPATVLARPSRKSRAPLMGKKESAALERKRGSRIRVKEKTTSSAVTSRPW